MRSTPPFFEDHLTNAVLDRASSVTGTLVLYCGAGVTIDRTGHSWASLVTSGFAEQPAPMQEPVSRKTVAQLGGNYPEQLASSLIYLLRESAGSEDTLRGVLQTRLRSALYGNPARWQHGELVRWLVFLAVLRGARHWPTKILTSNYDDHIEAEYQRVRADLRTSPAGIPGLRVWRTGVEEPIRQYAPDGLANYQNGAYIDLVYLHGSLPREDEASWPLILDENGYASSAPLVENEVAAAFDSAELSLILGSSIRDTPLVRSLSLTRNRGGERIAVVTRGQFANQDPELERLSLLLARHRAAELCYSPLFPDFNGQVAQFVTELALRTGIKRRDPSERRSLPYIDRLTIWWTEFLESRGQDRDLPAALRSSLADVLDEIGVVPRVGSLEVAEEQFQLELWLRVEPGGPNRSVTRWARSGDANTHGVMGKTAPLESGSYLAPVRAFVEGRPRAFDVRDLETGRESADRYSWQSFLSVPIRIDLAIVGVLTLASDKPLNSSKMWVDTDTTENVVALLRNSGERLLRPGLG